MRLTETYLRKIVKEELKLLLETWKVYINEKDTHSAKWSKLAAPNDALFNKYAFSPERQEMENPPPKEPNNKIEKEYLIALTNHFEGTKLLSLEKAQKLKELMQSGLYSDILKPPTKPVVYRGMIVTKKYIIDKLGIDPTKVQSPVFKEVTFVQDKNASSWTTSLQVASDFSEKDMDFETDDDVYTIVFHANVADNKENLLDCDGLYDIENIGEFQYEYEVISLGNIVASKVSIRRAYWYV